MFISLHKIIYNKNCRACVVRSKKSFDVMIMLSSHHAFFVQTLLRSFSCFYAEILLPVFLLLELVLYYDFFYKKMNKLHLKNSHLWNIDIRFFISICWKPHLNQEQINKLDLTVCVHTYIRTCVCTVYQ